MRGHEEGVTLGGALQEVRKIIVVPTFLIIILQVPSLPYYICIDATPNPSHPGLCSQHSICNCLTQQTCQACVLGP